MVRYCPCCLCCSGWFLPSLPSLSVAPLPPPYCMTSVSNDKEQPLDSLRQKASLRGAETTEISVRLAHYSASHFEGFAHYPNEGAIHFIDGLRAFAHLVTDLPQV